jgi:hypothetical protein
MRAPRICHHGAAPAEWPQWAFGEGSYISVEVIHNSANGWLVESDLGSRLLNFVNYSFPFHRETKSNNN